MRFFKSKHERMIHMKKFISVLIAAVLLVLAVSMALSESQGTTMYVKTPNGKALNVRSSMSSADDSNVIGSLRYGSKVITYGGKDGWLLIDYGNAAGYIMAKYLVKEKPAPYDGSSSGSSGAKKAGSFNVKEATNVAQLNSLAASAKFVTPYSVTVHPTTAKGSVYVRWFPTKNAETLLTLGDGYELTVIAELTDWYQVSDPASGKVGFVYYTYVK